MFCPNCGQQNADDCLFCVSCGTKVEITDEETIQVNLSSGTGEKPMTSDFSTGSEEASPPPPQEEKIPPPPENKNYSSSTPSGSMGGEAKTNILAIVSMVMAILGILLCCSSFLGGLLCAIPQIIVSLAGTLLGIFALRQIGSSNGTQKGNIFAWIGIAGSVLMLIASVITTLAYLGLLGLAILPSILNPNSY